MTTNSQTSIAKTRTADLYRAVWRWHFYAGLLVLPFLISMAVTGALYLFRDEIDAFVHADLKKVAVEEPRTAPSALVAAALSAHPGQAVKYTDPPWPDASAEITVQTDNGQRLAVYVNPYTGVVLGALPDRGTIMWTIRRLHSLKEFGPVARGIIEIVGGWSILLVATGVYLWWPRGQSGGVVSLRGGPRRRIFWRDLHAVTGLFVGGVVIFLAITGMPWSGVWGAKVNEWANGSNFGYPSGVRVDVPMSEAHLDHVSPTSWSLEQAKIPRSAGHGTPIGIDRAVEIVNGLGLHRGYALALPTKPEGVYSASVYPDDLSRQRVVHLDQYSGTPLVDMSYSDYGPVGRALEWGINVHMGQEFGRANQFTLLGFCAMIVVLCVSAGVMWWKRRPERSLGVPPLPSNPSRIYGIAGILAVGGVVFPLTGASFLLMLVLDRIVFWRRAAQAA